MQAVQPGPEAVAVGHRLGADGAGQGGQGGRVAEHSATFNRPQKFTVNSIGVQGARKDTLTARVYVKPVDAKGVSSSKTYASNAKKLTAGEVFASALLAPYLSDSQIKLVRG